MLKWTERPPIPAILTGSASEMLQLDLPASGALGAPVEMQQLRFHRLLGGLSASTVFLAGLQAQLHGWILQTSAA